MSLSKQDIENEIKRIISETKRIPVNSINLTDDDEFLFKFNLDSIEAVTLAMEISQVFGFSFGESSEDIESLNSYGTLIRLISRKATSAEVA